ncbi:MAG: glycosyltransferase [Alteromonadaceae bacterium]|nr:glycosyltransferase [Alteromonadaceae bacterium]
MKLSILTVCLNSEATIGDTIQSVLKQTYKDYEFIIFDGGSSDRTVEIIRSYGNRVRLIEGRDKGIFDAMNQAISKASGDVIGILNSDDLYVHDSVLSKVVNTFISKNVDSVYGDLFYVKRNNINKILRTWRSGQYNKYRFQNGWAPPHPTFFVKRSIYKKFGVFDTSFDISGDYELMLRFLFKNNISSCYIPDFLVKMRTGGNSSGNLIGRLKSFREDERAWHINGLKKKIYTIHLKVLSKIPQFFR